MKSPGKADSGSIFARHGFQGNSDHEVGCVTGDIWDTSASYVANGTATTCLLLFRWD